MLFGVESLSAIVSFSISATFVSKAVSVISVVTLHSIWTNLLSNVEPAFLSKALIFASFKASVLYTVTLFPASPTFCQLYVLLIPLFSTSSNPFGKASIIVAPFESISPSL